MTWIACMNQNKYVMLIWIIESFKMKVWYMYPWVTPNAWGFCVLLEGLQIVFLYGNDTLNIAEEYLWVKFVLFSFKKFCLLRYTLLLYDHIFKVNFYCMYSLCCKMLSEIKTFLWLWMVAFNRYLRQYCNALEVFLCICYIEDILRL